MNAPRPTIVTVLGGGVAGLASAIHTVELWAAARAEGQPLPPLSLQLVAPLIPTGGPGNGLGGKAMSRTFTGPADEHGNDRAAVYGPAMPDRGTIPHGYHVLWAYPNLRRLLRAGRPDEPQPPLDGGLLRPAGGAGVLAVFQGIVDDPTPGGPGIALMGLSDPRRPETATLPATRALYRLAGGPLGALVTRPFRALFAAATDGLDPLSFADLLFAREVDLEMRLALVGASLVARTTDPEAETVSVGGVEQPLHAVEYDAWLEETLGAWAARIPDVLDGELSGWQEELAALIHVLRAQLDDEDADAPEGFLDAVVDALLPDVIEEVLDDLGLVAAELDHLVEHLPEAALRLAGGQYPVARTLHMRFGPDATFTSPYSYDAASALRSLAFVFTSPESARVQSADGARIHPLWVRLWEHLVELAGDQDDVDLTIVAGRATGLAPHPDDPTRVRISRRAIRGHGFGADDELSYPHTFQHHPWRAPGDTRGDPAPDSHLDSDVVVPAVPPGILRTLLPAPATPAEEVEDHALARLAEHANATLELVMWTRDRLEYDPFAREGLRTSSITGLEGGWCLLADYSQGLWSEAALAEEDPFGDGAFAGSVLESCGGFDDLFACRTRDDAYGWPAEVKEAVAAAVADPSHYAWRDERPWPSDEEAWRDRRAGGGWTETRIASPEARDDWFVASRWMAWQFLRQLSQVQALGPRAVRQLRRTADLLDPRGLDRAAILAPPAALLDEIRFVVMINAKARNRIFSPGVGTWPLRHVSGRPLAGQPRVFPAGDWTRNGCDVICMEAATLSGLRAARGAFRAATGRRPPLTAPQPRRVMPSASWYASTEPRLRGEEDAARALDELGIIVADGGPS